MKKVYLISALLFSFALPGALFAQKKGKTDKGTQSPVLTPAAGADGGLTVVKETAIDDSPAAKLKNSNGIFVMFVKNQESTDTEGLKEIIRRFPQTQLLAYPDAANVMVMVNKNPEFALFQEAYGGRYLIFKESDFELIQAAFPCAPEFRDKLIPYVNKNAQVK